MQPQHQSNLPIRRQLSLHIGVRLQSASPSTTTIIPPAPQTTLHPQVAHHHSHPPYHNHLKDPRLYHPPNPTSIISPLSILKSIHPSTPRLLPQNIPKRTHAPVDSAHPSINPTYPEAPQFIHPLTSALPTHQFFFTTTIATFLLPSFHPPSAMFRPRLPNHQPTV